MGRVRLQRRLSIQVLRVRFPGRSTLGQLLFSTTPLDWLFRGHRSRRRIQESANGFLEWNPFIRICGSSRWPTHAQNLRDAPENERGQPEGLAPFSAVRSPAGR